jgi:putative tryptophan/tyrosine transport system substrate-binding protein
MNDNVPWVAQVFERDCTSPSDNVRQVKCWFSHLMVLPDVSTMNHRDLIIALAARHRLPAIYPFRYFAASGGLLSYGTDVTDVLRRAASYADRILKGARPGELPVQGPTKFELVMNLRAAKMLGIAMPPLLLARADEVIE